MHSANDLWADVLRVAPAKLIAAALGRHLGTIYRWAETDGGNGLLNWFETTVELLAVRPNGRPTLIRLHHWADSLFRRALRLGEHSPISTARLRHKAVLLLRETADVIEGTSEDNIDQQKLLKDAIEVRDLVERIIAHVEAGIVDEDERPHLRAAR